MKVLHIVPSLARAWGGPVTVVENLTSALSADGVECTVIAATCGRFGSDAVSIPGVSTTLFPLSFFGRFWIGHSFSSSSWINEHIRGFDVVHIHELWNHLHYVGAKAARRYGIPYIIRPCGELGDWELAQKKLKKRLFMALSQRETLQKASAIQALTRAEETSIKRQGISVQIHVIPNGVSPINLDDHDTSNIEKLFRELQPGPKILFLGRLHLKKGVDLLFETLARVLEFRPSATLIIAGPDEDGSGSKLLRRFQQSATNPVHYRFVGAIGAAEARMALRLSDIYVQPSRSEGFSMSTLEAISEGTPSVITTGCNFDEIESDGAGRVVAPDPIELADAIIEVIRDPEAAQVMSANAISLAARYSWQTVSRRVAGLYESVIS